MDLTPFTAADLLSSWFLPMLGLSWWLCERVAAPWMLRVAAPWIWRVPDDLVFGLWRDLWALGREVRAERRG
jgi:hypothetical protein